jgi:hypothetical protein
VTSPNHTRRFAVLEQRARRPHGQVLALDRDLALLAARRRTEGEPHLRALALRLVDQLQALQALQRPLACALMRPAMLRRMYSISFSTNSRWLLNCRACVSSARSRCWL